MTVKLTHSTCGQNAEGLSGLDAERCRSGRTGRSRKQTFIAPSQASSLKTFAERIENVSGIRKTALHPHEQGKNLRNIGAGWL